MTEISLLSIDVGFDLRLHDYVVGLPKDKFLCVKYHPKGTSVSKTVGGTPNYVKRVLKRNGYKV